jgi:acyl-CoA thioester hydrolase
MPKVYRCELEVRGYELDSYKHVNHAVYISYCEHARWKMLEQEGITLPKLDSWQRWPVIARFEAQYLKPTFLGDRLIVETECVEHSRTSFTFEHRMLRGDTLVFKAKVHGVMVNEKGRPSEYPDEVKVLWGDA